MRRVLVLAYHFPPIGGAGTQRTLKFVRYLPDFGFEPIVVTSSGAKVERWSPPDVTFLEEAGIARVVRVAAAEPCSSKWSSRVRRGLFLAEPEDAWWCQQLVRTAASECVDLIWATGPPYSTLEAGRALSRESGRPWVADLRDLWALDEMELYPSAAHRTWIERKMARTLETAALVVTTSQAGAVALRKAIPEIADRIRTITNGFDSADFRSLPFSADFGARFRIVHAGYFHTEEGRRRRRFLRRALGGAQPHVDVLSRSPVFLVEALARLLREDSGLGDRLDVVFAGVLSPADREVVARLQFARTLGYVSHADAIALMRSADLLFLPMQNTRDAPSTTIPGKTFEYIASGRPILAAVPTGDARDLLHAAGATVCSPDDVAGIAAAVRRHIEMGETEQSGASNLPDWAQFERRALTADLARCFEQVLDAVGASGLPPSAFARENDLHARAGAIRWSRG